MQTFKMSSVYILYSNFHLPEMYSRIQSKIKINFMTPKLKITESKNYMSSPEVRVTRKINPYLNPPIIFNDLMSISTPVKISSSYLSSSSPIYNCTGK